MGGGSVAAILPKKTIINKGKGYTKKKSKFYII